MTIFDRLKDWWLGTPKAQPLPAPNTQDEIIVIQPAPEPVAVVETQIPVAEPVVVAVAEPEVVAVAEPVVAPVAVVAEPVVVAVAEPAVAPVAVAAEPVAVAEPVVAPVAGVAEPVVAVAAEPVVEVAKPAKVKKTRKPKAEVVATAKKVSKKKHKS